MFPLFKERKNFPSDIPNVPRGKLSSKCSKRERAAGIWAVRFSASEVLARGDARMLKGMHQPYLMGDVGRSWVGTTVLTISSPQFAPLFP